MGEVTAHSLVIVGGRRGRPPRAGTTSTCRVEILVTTDEFAALKHVAAEQHQPVGAIVREAVNVFVADYGERRVFRSGPFE